MEDLGSLELENFLPDISDNYNDTSEEDEEMDFTYKDEFFHNKDEYGISEYYGCKKMLYMTAWSSNVKVWDMMFLIPGTLFLLFLAYSAPRTRHKLTSVPLPLLFLYFFLVMAPTISTLRSLLASLLPPSPQMDKVGWSLARTTNLALELVGLLACSLNAQPSPTRSRVLLMTSLLLSSTFLLLDISLELTRPAKEFHVYGQQTNLYGEGGGMFVCLTSLPLSLLYSLLLTRRVVSKPPSLLLPSSLPLNLYLATLLGVQLARGVGGLLVYQDTEFGICLTSLTLLGLVTLLPPLSHLALLAPWLGGFGGYTRQSDEEWDANLVLNWDTRQDTIVIQSQDITQDPNLVLRQDTSLVIQDPDDHM